MMAAWQDRVKEELDELQTKIDSLDEFFDTEKFEELAEAEQVRLRMQSKVMQIYAEILEERIEAFEEETDE